MRTTCVRARTGSPLVSPDGPDNFRPAVFSLGGVLHAFNKETHQAGDDARSVLSFGYLRARRDSIARDSACVPQEPELWHTMRCCSQTWPTPRPQSTRGR